MDETKSVDIEERAPTRREVSFFVSFCVEQYVLAHGLSRAAAVAELQWHKVLRFLADSYDVEHTLSVGQIVDDMDIMTGRAREDEYGVVSR